MLNDNINSIYAMIDSLSEEELFKPHMRKWADEATKTAVWEVYKFIHVNTVAPYREFRFLHSYIVDVWFCGRCSIHWRRR